MISSIGLVFSYLIWMPLSNFSFSDNIIIIGFISNAVFQTISWVVISKLYSIKKLYLFLLTISVTLISFNLWDYWKFEKYYNWNEKKNIIIKLVDSETVEPIVGDSIRLSAERQPLYGIMSRSEIGKSSTDNNGLSEFEVYIENEIRGRIWRNNGFYDYFEIRSKEIIENDTIVIKTTAKNGYK